MTHIEFICSMVNQNISDPQQIQAMAALLLDQDAQVPVTYENNGLTYNAVAQANTKDGINYLTQTIKVLLKDKKRDAHNNQLRGINRKHRQHKLKSQLIPHTLGFVNGELREKEYTW